MKIIDITQEILSCRIYTGDPEPKAERLKNMENGEKYNLSAFSMCAHNGTHVDAPLHFIKNGKSIDQLPIDNFIGDCFVAVHNGNVTAADAAAILNKAKAAGADERILIKGEATVTAGAAKVFADYGIKLIGNESQSIGPENAPMEVHLILLEKEVVLLEGLVLKDADEGKYFLSALPLNIASFEGSPCRAYLIKN